MSTIAKPPHYSIAEYLAREEQAPTKSEYYNGEIFAMAGATVRHNLISGNVFAYLHALLRNQDCRPYGSDLRIKVEQLGLFTYADTVVVCGEVQPADDDPHCTTNPRVIIEVLSRSTEAYDRGKKFRFYQQIATLQEYILIAQDEPVIERFTRAENDKWIISTAEGLQAWLEFDSIHCRVALQNIYESVHFGPEAEGAPDRVQRA